MFAIQENKKLGQNPNDLPTPIQLNFTSPSSSSTVFSPPPTICSPCSTESYKQQLHLHAEDLMFIPEYTHVSIALENECELYHDISHDLERNDIVGHQLQISKKQYSVYDGYVAKNTYQSDIVNGTLIYGKQVLK